jgi:2-haloacid dehalogenase
MMVACHPGDLDAAKSRGLMTAYVHRPLEWGPGTERPLPEAGRYDVIVHSFTELAEVMGA